MPESERVFMPYPKEPTYEPALANHRPPDGLTIKDSDVSMRLNKKPRTILRFPTFTGYDDVTNGLPAGLTIAYGAAGCGKSMFARQIATALVNDGKRVLYVYSEDSRDAPRKDQFDIELQGNYNTLDFSAYLPRAEKAIETLVRAIVMLKPHLVVIDSVTTFLSSTSKAVGEADVRENTFKLAKIVSGSLPVIGISEVRGTGYSETTAGGTAVKHAGVMLLEMKKDLVNRFNAALYDAPEGSFVWLMKVEKDRDGCAAQGNLHQVILTDEENPVTGEMEPVIVTRKVEYRYERG